MHNTPSNRIKALAESATIAMAQKSRELKSEGKDIISLSLGEPDFKTPDHIRKAAKQAIDDGRYFSYPPVAGYADLRNAISEKLVKENNILCSTDNIVVSSGAKHSIANVFMCLINPGDEVLVIGPYWVSYIEMIKLAEGVPVILTGTIENNFKVTPEQIKETLTKKTRAVIFSSPCNPTGAVFSYRELKNIANVLVSRKDIYIISDEIYEYINYTGEHASIGSLPEMKDNTITVNGFSKGFAMTGWRVGYISAPVWLAEACIKLQGQVTSGISSIAQRAALAGITGSRQPVKDMAKIYRNRRNMAYMLLNEIPGFRTPLPEGAFYFFPDVSYYLGKSIGKSVIRDTKDLCMYLLNDALVSTVTGEAFGSPQCIRLSYSVAESELKEAIRRIGTSLAKLK